MPDPIETPEDGWSVTVTVPARLPDAMKDALFTAVADAAHAWEPADRDGWDVDVTGAPTAPRAMAAVIPEIEKRVREQVAAEIEAERSGGTEHWVVAMDHAARIARGESR